MDKNKEVYNHKQVVNWYSQLHDILPVEKSVFEEYKDLLQTGKLLDIGIGGGRTTSYLIKFCKEYVGIDYSEKFVDSVNDRHPGLNCLVMDARDMSEFNNQLFGFINFSFNGIDYVDFEGRKKILSEINRILKPNGIFFFSTHNKNHSTFSRSPWTNKNNSFITNMKTFLKLVPYLGKKLRQKSREQFYDNYAIINDSAHNYGLMTFYTSPDFLRKQLTDAGFGEIKFYLKSGKKKEDAALDDWIFVTAKKI